MYKTGLRVFMSIMILMLFTAIGVAQEVFSVGCPVKASSIASDVYAPDPVTDGQYQRGEKNMWVSSGGFPHWLAVDLGQERTFNLLKLGSSMWGGVIKSGQIQGSNFAAAWTNPDRDAYWSTIDSFELPQARQEVYTFAFAPVSFRYVRFHFTTAFEMWNNVQITEMEIAFVPLQLTVKKFSNLFANGEELVVDVKVASSGSCNWQLVDFWGEVVSAGSIPVTLEGGAFTHQIHIASPGLGYYELSAELAGLPSAKQTVALGVLPSSKQLAQCPIASDAAISWLVSPNRFEDISILMNKAGIAWVRDRISWSEVEPSQGQFNWGKYEQSVASQAKEGAKISMAFHDAPAWAREPGHALPTPKNMYHFAYQAGKHFAGKIQAWEIWNEADEQFSSSIDTPAYYAAVLKAAYLGFKAADPGLMVLLAGWAGNRVYPEQVLANDVGAFFDVYNEHAHTSTDYTIRKLPTEKILSARCLLDKAGLTHPIWVTEAGIGIEADHHLSRTQQIMQARYLVQSIPTAISAGVAKHFYFILPYYKEGIRQWGVLRDDFTPYPAYVSFAVLNNMLGDASYLGKIDQLPQWATGYVFHSGQGIVNVLWSDIEQEIQLPKNPNLVVRNFMGQEQELAGDNSLRLKLGPDPIYLLGEVPFLPAGEEVPHVKASSDVPKVIPLLKCKLPYQKDKGYILQGETDSIEATVSLVNFQEQAVSGIMTLALPQGWSYEPGEFSFRLEPLEEKNYTFQVKLGSSQATEPFILAVKGFVAEGELTASTVHLFSQEKLPVTEEKEITQILSAQNWLPDNIGNGKVDLKINEQTGIATVGFTFNSANNWAYPRLLFRPEVDWSAWQGLSFKIRLQKSTATLMRLMIAGDFDEIPQNGEPVFFTARGFSLEAEAGWYEIQIPFSSLVHWSGSPPDPEGKLDLGRISWLTIGVNHSESGYLELEIKDLKLFR